MIGADKLGSLMHAILREASEKFLLFTQSYTNLYIHSAAMCNIQPTYSVIHPTI